MHRLAMSCLIALAAALLPVAGAGAPDDTVRQLEWDDLMPADWDPFAKLRELTEGGRALDDSPAAVEAMREYTAASRQAPVVAALDGQRVRLPGFVVPLDFEGTEVAEFLLVPYFGACIHVPPPPANQIVYVTLASAYKLKELFDPVWVTGTISTRAKQNDVGDAGYTLEATRIEPYVE